MREIPTLAEMNKRFHQGEAIAIFERSGKDLFKEYC